MTRSDESFPGVVSAQSGPDRDLAQKCCIETFKGPFEGYLFFVESVQ